MRSACLWCAAPALVVGMSIVGCSSGRRLYVGMDGIGIAVERKFSVSNQCIVVDSPLDLVLRSTEYGKRMNAKDAFGVSAEVAYDAETGAATTNWHCGAGVCFNNPWRGFNVSGSIALKGDAFELSYVGCSLVKDRGMSIRECAKSVKEIVGVVEDWADVSMALRDLEPEETQIEDAEKSWSQLESCSEYEFLRYCGKSGEGRSASEYFVTGHVNSNCQCRIYFAFAVAGELSRSHAPTEGDRKWEEARAYRDGTCGRERNPDKARELFLAVGERYANETTHLRDLRRVELIGEWYEKGTDPFPRDCGEAIRWYRRAADVGSYEKLRKVADFYEEGKGVAKDLAEAQRLRQEAEEIELTRPALADEEWRSRYGKIESPFDLEIGSSEIARRQCQCLQSKCDVGFDFDLDVWDHGKTWSHRMLVVFARPWHGFDVANLSFDEKDLTLKSYALEVRKPSRQLTEEECEREVEAIAREYETCLGVDMKLQPMPKRGSKYQGRLIRWYHGTKGNSHYSLAALKDADGLCRIEVSVARNSWRIYE